MVIDRKTCENQDQVYTRYNNYICQVYFGDLREILMRLLSPFCREQKYQDGFPGEALNDLHEGETEAERGQGKSEEAPKGPKRRNFVENGKSLMVVEPEV